MNANAQDFAVDASQKAYMIIHAKQPIVVLPTNLPNPLKDFDDVLKSMMLKASDLAFSPVMTPHSRCRNLGKRLMRLLADSSPPFYH
jgi:hypothetical protein